MILSVKNFCYVVNVLSAVTILLLFSWKVQGICLKGIKGDSMKCL